MVGRLSEIQSVDLDISDRKRAEEARRESELLFSAVFHASPVAIAITRLKDSQIVDANHAWLEVTGFTRDEAIGHSPSQLNAWVHPGDRERLLARLREQGKVLNFEFQMRHKSGTIFHMLMSAEQLEVAGEPHMLSLAQDITDRKRAEATIRETHEFQRAILDSVSSHIAVVDGNGVILAVNEPWRRFAIENGTEAGRPARHTESGVNYLDICRASHGESSEGAMAAHDGIRAVLDGGLPGFALEYPCHSPEEQRWFIMTVTPLGAGVRGVVVAHMNITDRKRAEEELRASHEQLRALAARLQDAREEEGTRIAREIHDVLAQELTRLKIDLVWLQSRLAKSGKAARPEVLLDRVAEMSQMADVAIHCVQKIATELRPAVLDSLGLGAAVEWHVRDFQTRSGIQCHAQVPEEEQPVDRAFATAVFRILQESLTNVLRHARATWVHVLLRQECDRLLLQVRDNGCGIAPETLSNPLSIGLAGMRERTLLLGGQFEISSRPGTGTTIEVRFPLSKIKDQSEEDS
jgi:PAS domain S-box-containing protein